MIFHIDKHTSFYAQVQTSCAAPVGIWKCKVETLYKSQSTFSSSSASATNGSVATARATYTHPEPIYIIFNPYSKRKFPVVVYYGNRFNHIKIFESVNVNLFLYILFKMMLFICKMTRRPGNTSKMTLAKFGWVHIITIMAVHGSLASLRIVFFRLAVLYWTIVDSSRLKEEIP